MDIEELEEIFNNDDSIKEWDGCNATKGLSIIQKYLPEKGIEAAEHDIIYSVDVEDLIDAGLTVEDAKKLHLLNWMISEGYFSCYI